MRLVAQQAHTETTKLPAALQSVQSSNTQTKLQRFARIVLIPARAVQVLLYA